MTNANKAALKKMLLSKAWAEATGEVLSELPFPDAGQVMAGQYAKDCSQHLFTAGVLHGYSALLAKTSLTKQIKVNPQAKHLTFPSQPA